MYFWAWTGSTSMGMARTLASIFSRARASGSPSCSSRAPLRSASYSRLRLSAICSRPEARGAELGQRDAVGLREPAGDPGVVGHLLLGHGYRAGALDGELVGEPVRPAYQRHAEHKSDDESAAPEDATDADQQGAERRQQDVGL